jgi:GT2 family glycosyltransferase
MSVVVVNHNGGARLRAAIRALQANTVCHRAEVIVVDAGSTDDSAQDLPEGPLPVRVLGSPDNVGFCRGNNLGASAALGRLLVFTQPDGEVGPRWDEALRAAIDQPGVAVVGGVVLKMGPGEVIDSAGIAIAPNFAAWSLSENLTPVHAGLRNGQWREVVGVSPAFLMARRADHERIGGFWEELWMYGDEPDYAVRMRALGRALVCPEASMRHWVGASAGAHQSPLRLYQSARNRLLNSARHLPARRVVIAVALTIAFDTWQVLQQRRPEAARAVLRGWWAGLRGMPAARRLGTSAERAHAASHLATLREALIQQRALGRVSLRDSPASRGP